MRACVRVRGVPSSPLPRLMCCAVRSQLAVDTDTASSQHRPGTHGSCTNDAACGCSEHCTATPHLPRCPSILPCPPSTACTCPGAHVPPLIATGICGRRSRCRPCFCHAVCPAPTCAWPPRTLLPLQPVHLTLRFARCTAARPVADITRRQKHFCKNFRRLVHIKWQLRGCALRLRVMQEGEQQQRGAQAAEENSSIHWLVQGDGTTFRAVY